MIFGILNIDGADTSIDIVRCNMCYAYYYDAVFFDTRDERVLQIVWDNEDEEYVKGCGNCKTDAYLIDMISEQLSACEQIHDAVHL